jgi:type I restriction enzyme S subunit
VSWKTVGLGTLVELITKGTTPTSIGHQFSESGINFIKIESINLNGKFIPEKFAKINGECHEVLKRSQLKEGDILFSIAGALGRTAIVTKDILPANTNQALAIIRLKNSELISKEYLIRVLNSEGILNQMGKMKGGVAQQNLSLTQIKDFQIPLPSIATQQKIVAKLDQIFAEIDRATVATEANAKKVIDLDSQILNSLDDDFEGILKELGSCVDMVSGFAFKSDEYTSNADDIPLLRGDNLNPRYIDFSDVKRFDKNRFSEFLKFSLNIDDIVLGMDRPLISTGLRIAKIKQENLPSLLVQRVMRMRCKEGIDPDFIFYKLNSKSFIKHLLGEQTGLGVPHISGKTISSFQIKIPSLESQKSIVKKLNSLNDEMLLFNKSNLMIRRNFNDLKFSILKQAFSGELVKE